MTIEDQLNEVCAKALSHFGSTPQLAKFHEEVAELTVAITHGAKVEDIINEAADVVIMAWQMGMLASNSAGELEAAILHKLERLRGMLKT